MVSNEVATPLGAGSSSYRVIVCCLFLLVALLVGFGLGLIWLALLGVQGLPPLAQNLADLAYNAHGVGQ